MLRAGYVRQAARDGASLALLDRPLELLVGEDALVLVRRVRLWLDHRFSVFAVVRR